MNAHSDSTLLLGHLPAGKTALVAAFSDDPAAADIIERLREIGFSEGLEVEFLHKSMTSRGPIAVRIDSATVALRRPEANLVKVRLV